MAYTRREHKLDMDQVAAYLQDAVNRVKTEEDPDVLNELKKVFKKNVPFTLRGYVAAYLLKNTHIPFKFSPKAARNDRADFNRRDNRSEKTERAEKPAFNSEKSAEVRERAPRPQLDASVSTTIFIGVGKNRRVFPKDLVGLICSVCSLDRERIGEIRVLANYSFVQLLNEDAEKVINTLNGYEYRGRKLSVSFSRAKDEGETADSQASFEDDRIPDNVENVSAKVEDSFAKENADTMAQQAAFAAQQAATQEMTDEEIMAARAPRSSSSEE